LDALKAKTDEIEQFQQRSREGDEAHEAKLKEVEEAKAALESQLHEAQESYAKLQSEYQEGVDLLKTVKDEVCIPDPVRECQILTCHFCFPSLTK